MIKKKALSKVDRELNAKIAEIEIITSQRITEAGSGGDLERVDELRSGKVDEINRLRRQAEEKKKDIRKGGV